MKRILGLVMGLALIASASAPAMAQTSRGRYYGRAAQQRRYDNGRRYDYGRYDRRDDDRSFWEEHRDKLTVAGGAAAGAVVGGVAGGKKGAIIGAIVGAAGSALYTYKLRDRDEDDDWRDRRDRR
ncbi:MAG TPA: glycine zipper domain-containing protein [Pyrinomonadaceae bacterium]|nr:glycine zipper domain-containing protein [Pyrinomonadaceae bacterium]